MGFENWDPLNYTLTVTHWVMIEPGHSLALITLHQGVGFSEGGDYHAQTFFDSRWT